MMKSSSKEAKIESIAVIFSESWPKEKGGETGTHIRGHLAHQVRLGLKSSASNKRKVLLLLVVCHCVTFLMLKMEEWKPKFQATDQIQRRGDKRVVQVSCFYNKS